MTILPCEAANYDKYYVIVWPYFGILATEMIMTKALPTQACFFYYLPAAVLWSVAFHFIKGTDKVESEGDDSEEDDFKAPKLDDERYMLPGNWYILITTMGMIQGFIWTYYASGLMIDALTFVGILTKLSATYLALTIIAVGNALPDALLTISLASKGKAELGITGGYAGQLFGLLVGFGISMLKKSLDEGKPVPFPLFAQW